MKFDKRELERMINLPDDQLWAEVNGIARKYGLSLPEKCPEHSEMQKLRSTVGSGMKINVNDALRLINKYKKGV